MLKLVVSENVNSLQLLFDKNEICSTLSFQCDLFKRQSVTFLSLRVSKWHNRKLIFFALLVFT